MPSGDLPGWGDLGHPDEYDDDRCEECGNRWECEDYCTCDLCFPFSCDLCDRAMTEDEVGYVNPENEEFICEECNRLLVAKDLANEENMEAKDWDDGFLDSYSESDIDGPF